MIVADTNLIVPLVVDGPQTAIARRVHATDADWAAPVLWRSEFRNALAGYMRTQALSVSLATRAFEMAESQIVMREHLVPTQLVFELVAASKCSAYDCEYVALAQQLGVPLITWDRELLREFPKVAISPTKLLRS